MNKLFQKYWLISMLIAAPLLRTFTDNTVINALTSFWVWAALWIIFAVVGIVFLVGAACHTWADEMKVDGLDRMIKPFAKMKWWKSAITASLVLAAYIYADWAGPAILYTINTVGMFASMALLKSGMLKVMVAHGIEIPDTESDEKPDDKPDELKALKKSSLL